MGSHRKPKFKLGPPPPTSALTFWQFHFRESVLDREALLEQFDRARSETAKNAMWAGVCALEERSRTLVSNAFKAGELLTMFTPEGA